MTLESLQSYLATSPPVGVREMRAESMRLVWEQKTSQYQQGDSADSILASLNIAVQSWGAHEIKNEKGV